MNLILFAVFVIYNIHWDKKWQKYWDKVVEIRRCDSVNLKVTKKLSARGYHHFNDSLYIQTFRMEEPVSLYVFNLYDKLELPFYLKKEADNDTLWLIDNNGTYFLVFRKDRDCD